MSSTNDSYQWTEESVSRFWGKLCTAPDLQLFGEQRGKSLVRFVRSKIKLRGPCLDVGCGKGDVLQYLCSQGIDSYGVDISEESVTGTTQRLSRHEQFKGCRRMVALDCLPYDSETFRSCFLIETIEHLFPHQIAPVLSEIRRVLHAEGKVIISCPYDENLQESSLVCPRCKAIFHRWQHQSSFNESSLKRIVEESGFRALLCGSVYLRPTWSAIFKQITRPFNSAYCPSCDSFFTITAEARAVPTNRGAALHRNLIFIGEKAEHIAS